MKKTYHGSCHCGAVRFECTLDLTNDTRRCNCSFCRKTRMWKAFARAGEFRVLQGADALSDYQAEPSSWPPGDVHHYFCGRCGVRGFSKGYLEAEEFGGDFHAVNIACLDDASDEELALAHASIRYEDGRGDRWEEAPAVVRHL